MKKRAKRAVAPLSAAVAGALDYLELDPRGTAAGLLAGLIATAAVLAGNAWGPAALAAVLLAAAAGGALSGLAGSTPQSQDND